VSGIDDLRCPWSLTMYLVYPRIALTNSGHLLDICPYTRTVHMCQTTQRKNLLIEDLLVMECSEESIELLVLTKPMDEGRFIKIVEYPSRKQERSMI